MGAVQTKEEAIQEIIKEAKKLDKLQLQMLLTRLRVKKLQKSGVKAIANPPKNVKMPTMKEIDRWKHASRTHARS